MRASSPRAKAAAKPAPAAKAVKASAFPPLENGQLWKMNEIHLEVIEIGKLLARVRIFKLQPRVTSSLDSILRIQAYLKTNKAKLIPNPRMLKKLKK